MIFQNQYKIEQNLKLKPLKFEESFSEMFAVLYDSVFVNCSKCFFKFILKNQSRHWQYLIDPVRFRMRKFGRKLFRVHIIYRI